MIMDQLQYQRDRRNKLRSLGICPCGNKISNGTYCNACKDRAKFLASQRRRHWKEEGLCVKCGEIKDGSLAKCLKCRELASASYNRRKMKLGVECIDCGMKVEGCRHCGECALKRCATKRLGTVSRWKDLQQLFENQNGLCPYTGISLTLGKDAELDHIVPKIKGGSNDNDNLQWVYRPVNTMKWNHSEDEFLKLVELIYEYKNEDIY